MREIYVWYRAFKEEDASFPIEIKLKLTPLEYTYIRNSSQNNIHFRHVRGIVWNTDFEKVFWSVIKLILPKNVCDHLIRHGFQPYSLDSSLQKYAKIMSSAVRLGARCTHR